MKIRGYHMKTYTKGEVLTCFVFLMITHRQDELVCALLKKGKYMYNVAFIIVSGNVI